MRASTTSRRVSPEMPGEPFISPSSSSTHRLKSSLPQRSRRPSREGTLSTRQASHAGPCSARMTASMAGESPEAADLVSRRALLTGRSDAACGTGASAATLAWRAGIEGGSMNGAIELMSGTSTAQAPAATRDRAVT